MSRRADMVNDLAQPRPLTAGPPNHQQRTGFFFSARPVARFAPQFLKPLVFVGELSPHSGHGEPLFFCALIARRKGVFARLLSPPLRLSDFLPHSQPPLASTDASERAD